MARTEEDFRHWLLRTQHYTERSAGNVLSRLKRAHRLIGSGKHFTDPRDEVHALQKSSEFCRLSTSVRSQLKRAVLLHSEYRSRR